MPGFEDEALLREREHKRVSQTLKALLVRVWPLKPLFC